MKKLALVILISFVVVANVCAQQKPDKVDPVSVAAWYGANKEVHDVNLKVGETWRLSLKSNPSTGYHWQTNIFPENQDFIKVADAFEAPARTGMVGVPGQHDWVVTALKQGDVKVELRNVASGRTVDNSLPDKIYRFFITK